MNFEGLGFRAFVSFQVLWLMAWGVVFKIRDLRFRINGLSLRVYG